MDSRLMMQQKKRCINSYLFPFSSSPVPKKQDKKKSTGVQKSEILSLIRTTKNSGYDFASSPFSSVYYYYPS